MFNRVSNFVFSFADGSALCLNWSISRKQSRENRGGARQISGKWDRNFLIKKIHGCTSSGSVQGLESLPHFSVLIL